MAQPQRSTTTTAADGSFAHRLVDGFFDRWVWYLAPIVLFAVIGLFVASGITGSYVAEGGLSSTSNPLVGQTQVRGAALNEWETPAAGTARLINEQLRTDVFAAEVAERAGLTEQINAEIITLDTLRERVTANPNGQSYLTVEARWDEPAAALALVDATIALYIERIGELVASDSSAAVDFWTELRDDAELRLDQAESELEAYVRNLPATENNQRTADEQLIIARLTASLDRAATALTDAERGIDNALLALRQAQSEAGRQLQVVDPPTMPTAPEPTRTRMFITFVMFTAMGLVLSAIVLVAWTALDRMVRTEEQLAAATGIGVSATIPRVKQSRSERKEGATAAPAVSTSLNADTPSDGPETGVATTPPSPQPRNGARQKSAATSGPAKRRTR